MHLLLFLGGLVSLALGGIAFGLGAMEIRDGNTAAPAWITPATMALVGGFVLLGLGSIARRLAILADMIETQPLPRSVAIPQDDPSLRQAALSVEPSHTSSGRAAPGVGSAPPRAAPPISVDTFADPQAAGATPVLTSGRSEIPDAAEVAALAVAPAVPLSEPLPGARPDPPLFAPSPAAGAPASGSRTQNARTAAANPAESVATETPHVIKSGVIEGMAYTLYSNGEVDADLPRHGILRFRSIAEWRAFVRAEG